MSRLALFVAANAADEAWMAEVARVFGACEAGLARVHGRAAGEPGSHLRDLHDRCMRTRDAYVALRH
jgi:hypothetical protein